MGKPPKIAGRTDNLIILKVDGRTTEDVVARLFVFITQKGDKNNSSLTFEKGQGWSKENRRDGGKITPAQTSKKNEAGVKTTAFKAQCKLLFMATI